MRTLFSKTIISASILSIILIQLSTLELKSQDGGYSSAYLLRNVGARANGMAGAYTAISNEPNAIFYNPGGIGFFMDNPTFSSNVSLPGVNRTHTNLAYGQKVSNNFGIGIGLNSFSSGTINGTDMMGNSIGTFTDWQYSFNGAFAYNTGDISLGAGAKYIGNSLTGSGTSANGFAFDLGGKFNLYDLMTLGVSVNNIGGTLSWNTQSNVEEQIPYQIRVGLGMEIGLNEETIEKRTSETGELETYIVPATKYILLAGDLIINQFEDNPSFVVGTEITPMELIAFRGGISIYGDNNGNGEFFPMNIWGAGFSLRPEVKDLPFIFNLDYSISNEILLGSGVAHHITIYIDVD